MKSSFLLLIFIIFIVFHCYPCSESEDHAAIRDYINQNFGDVGLTNQEIDEIIIIIQKNGVQNMDQSEEELKEYASKFDLNKKDKFLDALKTVKNQIDQIKEVLSRFVSAFANSGAFHAPKHSEQKTEELDDIFHNDEL